MASLHDLKTNLQHRIREAKQVLDDNWLGRSTKPAPTLYPHQWNWDSGFIAIGYARYRPDRAMTELSSLFDAQWDNGMVPQIVFNESALGNYFPEPDFWQCERSPDAPDHVSTSGITQPPVHALAVWELMEHAGDRDEVRTWIREFLPDLKRSHLYFYRHRDPGDEGLVYIRHPWESGLDNSPAWDLPLQNLLLDDKTIPPYTRVDLKDIPDNQRPTDKQYDRYVYLVDLFRRNAYDEQAIASECPFLIQEPMFNSILARANEALIELCDAFDVECEDIKARNRQTVNQIQNKLWNEEKGQFDPYDLYAETSVDVKTSADFCPLLCGAASEEQAERLYSHLESSSFCPMHDDTCFSIPNFNRQAEEFAPDNYWRGPVWINVNWLLMNGLFRYGYDQKARSIREDIVELIDTYGFHEYFDPQDGTGYGTDQFSWSAALFIDTALDIIEEIEDGSYTPNPSLFDIESD